MNRGLRSKYLRAFSLPTVIVIGVLICLLILFAIALFDFNNSYYSYYHRAKQQKEDINSAFVLYCNDSTLLTKIEKEGFYQLYEDDPQTAISIKTKRWGLYECVEVRATDNRYSSIRLLGKAQEYNDEATATLEVLPSKPEVDRSNLYLMDRYLKETEMIPSAEDSRYKTYYSFSEQEVHFYIPDDVRQYSIRGHVVLHGDDVVLSSETRLNDVLLLARRVIINEGFRGSLQIIATDTVILCKNAYLRYPSGVYLKGNNDRTYLQMNENSKLDGYAVIFGTTENYTGSHAEKNFKQAPTAIFNGLLYIDGVTDKAHTSTISHTGIYRNNQIGFPFFFKQSDYRRKEMKTLN